MNNFSDRYKIEFNGTFLEFCEGDFVLLCGPSGCGKTTLLNSIEKQLKSKGLTTGFVLQNFDAQIVTDKVWHEIAFGMENNGLSPELMHRRTAELTSYFGITDWLDKQTDSLSGGQKQLLNLASVMALKPDFLLLDEPSSQLDPVAAGNFINTVKKVNRELGTTIIMSEHRLEDLFAESSKVVILDEMKIFAAGSPSQVCKKIIEDERRDYFIEFLPVPARVAYRLKKKKNEKISGLEELPLTICEGRSFLRQRVKDGNCAEGVGGGDSCTQWSASARNSGQPDGDSRNARNILLKIKNLSFSYEKKCQILGGLDFDVEKGKIHAVVGANGSGKSTLLKVMAGLLKAKGKIEGTENVVLMSQSVGRTFSKTTVDEELKESGLKKLPELRGFEGFEKLMERHPYDLSGGEMQKLGLLKVLAKNPEVILLDEPTKGLDNPFKKELGNLLREIAKNGTAVVIVCHDLEFCAQTADEVSMMFEGRLTGTGSSAEFFGGNNFYTTAAGRMTSGIDAEKTGFVTEDDF